MHRSESYDRSSCLDCGAEVAGALDRAFSVGESGILCFACAVRRGGSYDEAQDHWAKPPGLSGLAISEADRSRVWK